jgi:hypothetical protein
MAAPVQRPPAGRPVPVATDTTGCGSVRGGHPPSGPDEVPEGAADSGRCPSVRCHTDTAQPLAVSAAAASCSRTAADPTVVIPARRERPGTSRLLLCAGHGRWTPTVRTRGQRRRRADTDRPQPPGVVDTAPAAGVTGRCGGGPLNSRQQNHPPPPLALMTRPGRGNDDRTSPHRISIGMVALSGDHDRQIRSLGAAGKLASSR